MVCIGVLDSFFLLRGSLNGVIVRVNLTTSCIDNLEIKKEATWILDLLFDPLQKGDCLAAVDHTMIVCKCNIHHWSDLNLCFDQSFEVKISI